MSCKLYDNTIQEIVYYLLMDYRNSIDSLNLSDNELSDDACS